MQIGGAGISSPYVVASFGSENIADAARTISEMMSSIATSQESAGQISSVVGGYQRRQAEWTFQANLALTEAKQIQSQIDGAVIRQTVAQTELDNHDLQTSNATDVDSYMRSKFSNQELYGWLV